MSKPAAKTPSAGNAKVSSPPRAPKLEPTPSPSEPIPDEPAAETSIGPDAEMDSEAEDKSPDDAAPPPDADVLAGTPPEHPACPDCQAKKAKRKGNGFPFGRKPLAEGEVPVTKRVFITHADKLTLDFQKLLTIPLSEDGKTVLPLERTRVIIEIAREIWEGCKDRKGTEVTVIEVDPDPEN